MIKRLINIKFLTCLLIFSAMFCRGAAHAQTNNEENTEIVVVPSVADSAVADIEEYEEDKVLDFSPVTPGIDSVKWNQLPAGYTDSLKNNQAFEYVKTGIPRPQEPKARQSSGFGLDSLFLYIAIAVFVGFLIWYLINNNIILFRKKSADIKDLVDAETEHEDIFSIQYKQAIQKALQNKNYRLAIRLHYLQLLKTLADKKIINYRPDKTNFDYLMQLRPTDHYNDFFTVTRNYEYSWYGLFNISEEQYQKMEQGFENFYNRVK